MTRAILYGRVSSKFQKEKGHRMPKQLDDMRAYAEDHNMVVIKEFEEAHTATMPFWKRPYGSQIYTLAQQNMFDALIVHTQDRLDRGDLDFEIPVDLFVLLRDMQDYGVEVHTVEKGLVKDEDLSVIFDGWRSNKENIERAKKIKEGQVEKIKKGLWLGNGPPSYGYAVEGHAKTAVLVIYEPEARIVRLIFLWYCSGIGVQEIANRLTEMEVPRRGSHTAKMPLTKWLPSHVYPILKRSIYRGVFYANRFVMVKVPGQRKKKRVRQDKSKWTAVSVPAIIDNDTWKKAQDRMKIGRAMSKRNTKYEYLIARRVSCKCGYNVCGKPCHTGKGDVYLYYRCNGKYGNLTTNECDLPLFSVKRTDNAVWGWVYNLLQNPEKMLLGYQEAQRKAQEANKPLLSELAQVESMVSEKETELSRLLDLYLSSSFEIEVLEERKRTLDQALFDLKKRQRQLEIEVQQSTITDEQIQDFVKFADAVSDELKEHVDFETKRGLLERLNLQAELFIEGGEKKVKITCYAGEGVVNCDSNSL